MFGLKKEKCAVNSHTALTVAECICCLLISRIRADCKKRSVHTRSVHKEVSSHTVSCGQFTHLYHEALTVAECVCCLLIFRIRADCSEEGSLRLIDFYLRLIDVCITQL